MRAPWSLALLLWVGCVGKDEVADDSGPDLVDVDGDGSPADLDCDDEDAARFPGNEEVCDGLDNDCDGEVDAGAVDALSGWIDGDGDGFGGEAVTACELPAEAVDLPGDCDDADAAVNPGAAEVCDPDDVDEDCDGAADDDDDDAEGTRGFWFDGDGDGYGDAAVSVQACDAPEGFVTDDTDCDDADAEVYPDNGCEGPDLDGRYSGDLVIEGEAPSVGLSDTCTGTGAAVVDGGDSPAIQGTLRCNFAGLLATLLGEQTATLTGQLDGGRAVSGEIDVQGLLSVPWQGEITADGRLVGEFAGTETVQGITANFSGGFELTRE